MIGYAAHRIAARAGLLAAALGVGLTLCGAAALASSPPDTEQTARAFALCERATARWERISEVPAGLLQAISLAESGRWSKADGRVRAWPWTVTSGGPGSYFETKAEALAEVARLQAKGIGNIDVGCMQINLGYHGENFTDAAHAIDPDINAGYAAKFLTQLRADADSWAQAAGYYHSRTPERTAYYRGKVEKFWAGLMDPHDLQKTVAAVDPGTALIAEEPETPAPLFVTPIDRARTAELNARFNTLKTAARKLRDDLDPEIKRQQQVDAWRNARAASATLQHLAAARTAEMAAKRERDLKAAFAGDRAQQFRENRRQQLAEWRMKIASGAPLGN